MVELKSVTLEDKAFWYQLDRHLAESEFYHIVELKRGSVIYSEGEQVGILRWNLFWDSIPFLTMIYLKDCEQKKGVGTQALKLWESARKSEGHHTIMTSTQVDETSQHFYRKLGFEDCGCLVLNRIPELEQPMEMFMVKEIKG